MDSGRELELLVANTNSVCACNLYSSRRLVGLFAYLYVCVCVGMAAVA